MLLAAESNSHAMLMTVVTAMSVGVLLTVVARKFGIPAIVLLLLAGIGLGPDVWDRLFGIAAPVRPGELGDGLRVIVSLSIGLILFEGGLTLDVSGYRSAPRMIKRLLTIGVVVTWFGTAALIKAVFQDDVSWRIAVIGGSLVIVTGPTVIAPLLKRVRLKHKIHSILHWEGVLIDPIGVFIALLCYEWVVQEGGEQALTNLALRIGLGLGVGAAGGYLLSLMVRRRIVPEEMINVFALGFAVLIFGIADAVREEAGLLAVPVAGFVFGLTKKRELKVVKQFKAEITDILIGTLFILLASRLKFEQFAEFGWRGALVVAGVMVIVRPISIFFSSIRTQLLPKEKLFLSWVAPRGIVAASMASLIAINLEDPFVETFTYSVIVSTVVVQGSTVALAANLLGLKREEPTGWLIVGANAFARRLANFLHYKADRKVLLIDSNDRVARMARSEGHHALTADARDTSLYERQDFNGIGNVLAVTDNEDLNVRICENWEEVVGANHVFRCDPTAGNPEFEGDDDGPSGEVLWPGLPRPSLISRELAAEEAEMIEVEAGRPGGARQATPIAWIGKNRTVRLDLTADEEEEVFETGKTLFLVRKAEYLLRAVHLELVLSLEPSGMEALFNSVMKEMVRLAPRLPLEDTVNDLLHRESMFPTLLGNGVAVPHAFSASIDRRLCAIVRIPEKMQFGAATKDDVDLLFLLISPQGDPEGHLATLAEIARLLSQAGVKQQLVDAGAPLEAIRIIREETRR